MDKGTELKGIIGHVNKDMSEALECLEKLSSKAYKRDVFTKESLEELKMPIKQALLKAQENENTEVIGGRTFGKDILNLKECVEKCDDKPILYISRTYGNKYIIPQKQLDDLTNENAEYKKVLEIIKKKGFDRSIEDYDNYNIWVEYKVEQFDKAIEKNPTIFNWDIFDDMIYTQEEFELLKRYFK